MQSIRGKRKNKRRENLFSHPLFLSFSLRPWVHIFVPQVSCGNKFALLRCFVAEWVQGGSPCRGGTGGEEPPALVRPHRPLSVPQVSRGNSLSIYTTTSRIGSRVNGTGVGVQEARSPLLLRDQFSNSAVDRYLSPVSGSSTTMRLPLFSVRRAAVIAAWSAAPAEMPHSSPSFLPSSRAAA